MLKKLLALAILTSMALSMAACETTKGAGKDIEKGGKNLQNAAERNE